MPSRDLLARDGVVPRIHDQHVTATVLDHRSESQSEDEAVTLLEKRGESCNESITSSSLAVDGEFPYKQFLVLVLCLAVEPIAFTTVVTYSFSMVQRIKGESNASFYAGLFISLYTFAEGSVAMFWGHVSDRYGRKPVWLLSLTGLLISTLIMGITQNYWIALGARALGGFLNGSVALTPTIISELVKRPEHEAAAFAVPSLTCNFGWILGSIIGGYAAEPSRLYPEYFSESGLFGRFPYLLPSLITSALLAVAIIVAYSVFEETHPGIRASQIHAYSLSVSTMEDVREVSRLNIRDHRFYDTIPVEESSSLSNEPQIDSPRLLSTVPHLSQTKLNGSTVVIYTQDLEDDEQEDSSSNEKLHAILNKEVLLWTGVIFLLAFQEMAFTSILPIYTLDSPQAPPQHLDLKGGLGANLQVSGEFGAFCGFVAIAVQTLYLLCAARSGVPTSVVMVATLCPLVYLVLPFVTLLSNTNAGMHAILLVKTVLAFVPAPSVMILLKNAAYSPMVLGRVMGFTMMICGIAKTVAPPLAGIIYSRFGSATAWWFSAVVATLAAVNLGVAYCSTTDKHKRPEDGVVDNR